MRDFKAKKGSLKSKTERRLAKWLYGIGRCCLFGKLSASRCCSVACRFGKDFRLPQSWQQQPIAPHAIQAQRQPENVFGGCCRFAETCFACFQAVPLSGADLLPAQAFRRLPRAGARPRPPRRTTAPPAQTLPPRFGSLKHKMAQFARWKTQPDFIRRLVANLRRAVCCNVAKVSGYLNAQTHIVMPSNKIAQLKKAA